MADLRELIIERVRTRGSVACPSVLDVYYHLVVSHGVCPDEASKAMSAFVDEIIAMKGKQHERPPVGT